MKNSRYFIPLFYVQRIGTAKNFQVNDINKLTENCLFIWNELNDGCSIYSHLCSSPMTEYGTTSFFAIGSTYEAHAIRAFDDRKQCR